MKEDKTKIKKEKEEKEARHKRYEEIFDFSKPTPRELFRFLNSNKTNCPKLGEGHITNIKQNAIWFWGREYEFGNEESEEKDHKHERFGISAEEFRKILDSFESFQKLIKDHLESYYYLVYMAKCIFWDALDRDLIHIFIQEGSEKLANLIDFQKTHKNLVFLRWEDDFSWELMPSCLRTLSKGEEVIHLDPHYLHKLYEDKGIETPEKIDYDFLVKMHLEKSFSPLLPVTNNLKGIKGIFEDHESNSNVSTMYFFELGQELAVCKDKDIVNDCIQKMEIDIIPSKIRPGSEGEIKDIDGEKHKIDFSTYDKILDRLVPRCLITNLMPTNIDGTKEKGAAFIMFYDFVLVGKDQGIFAFPPKDLWVFKQKVLPQDKTMLSKKAEN